MVKILPRQIFSYLDEYYAFYFTYKPHGKRRLIVQRYDEIKGKLGKFAPGEVHKYVKQAFAKDRRPAYAPLRKRVFEILPQYFRTQFSVMCYSAEMDYPVCEIKVWAYHKQPDEYDLIEFSNIEHHAEYIMSMTAGRSQKKFDAGTYKEVTGYEQNENQGSELTRHQKRAFRYTHRECIWFDKNYNVTDTNYESNFTTWELELIKIPPPLGLYKKLHHVKGILIPKGEKRDYTLKYVSKFLAFRETRLREYYG